MISDVAEIEEGMDLQCHSCLQKFPSSNMYRCKSCQKDLASTERETQNKIFFCKICIVGHFRRKHEVIDHKGYEPAICENHQNLCQYYCKTCQEVFCPDCIEIHSSHVFQPIQEKAAEFRSKVFECITENEMLAKPLKHKQVITKTCLKEKAELRESLGSRRIDDTLNKIYNQVICTNSQIWCNALKGILVDNNSQGTKVLEELQAVIAETDAINCMLKELLQISEGNLVKSFTAIQDKLETLVPDEIEQLKSHTYLQWTEDLEVLIQQSIINVLKEVRIPAIKNIQIEELELDLMKNIPRTGRQVGCARMDVISQEEKKIVWKYTDDLFGLNISQDKCSFSLLKEDNGKPSIQNIVLTDVEVKYVFFKVGYVAICTSMDTKVYCLDRNVFVYEFQIDKNCIPLQLYSWRDDTFSSLAWFEDSLRVKFTSNHYGELTLPEKPRLLGHYVEINSFTHSDNKVTIWHRKKNLRMNISSLQHGLPSVDNMKMTDEKTLFLFDHRLQLAVTFQFDLRTEPPRKFSLEKVLKITPFSTDPPKLMTVICGKIIACSSYEAMYSADLPT